MNQATLWAAVATALATVLTVVLTNAFQRRKLKAEADQLTATGTRAVFSTAIELSELVRRAEERSRDQNEALRERIYAVENELRSARADFRRLSAVVTAHSAWDVAAYAELVSIKGAGYPVPPEITLPDVGATWGGAPL